MNCFNFVRISLDFIIGFDKVSNGWMRYNADNELGQRDLVIRK